MSNTTSRHEAPRDEKNAFQPYFSTSKAKGTPALAAPVTVASESALLSKTSSRLGTVVYGRLFYLVGNTLTLVNMLCHVMLSCEEFVGRINTCSAERLFERKSLCISTNFCRPEDF